MTRKAMRRWVAIARKAVELRATGIRQAEESRRFVVRFACGIVVRPSENLQIGCRVHRDELRVTAGNEQCEKRVRRKLFAIEKRCEDVSVQVVDGVDRFVQCEGECFCRGNADYEAADQSRSGGYCDAVDLFEVCAGAVDRIFDGSGKQRDVTPSSDFRYDAAVFGVEGVLIGRDAGEHVPAVADEGGRGVVAGGFDAEDQHLPAVTLLSSANDSLTNCARLWPLLSSIQRSKASRKTVTPISAARTAAARSVPRRSNAAARADASEAILSRSRSRSSAFSAITALRLRAKSRRSSKKIATPSTDAAAASIAEDCLGTASRAVMKCCSNSSAPANNTSRLSA